ncbi:MAG: hypothetical protein IJW91_02215 [Phascolarctobacterium sp.]|nr:hypothetical protein [Phascolarctobacterium sp.]MBQ7882850.1 hypothetical protein [Phascolarctobacterium sp.]
MEDLIIGLGILIVAVMAARYYFGRQFADECDSCEGCPLSNKCQAKKEK